MEGDALEEETSQNRRQERPLVNSDRAAITTILLYGALFLPNLLHDLALRLTRNFKPYDVVEFAFSQRRENTTYWVAVQIDSTDIGKKNL